MRKCNCLHQFKPNLFQLIIFFCNAISNYLNCAMNINCSLCEMVFLFNCSSSSNTITFRVPKGTKRAIFLCFQIKRKPGAFRSKLKPHRNLITIPGKGKPFWGVAGVGNYTVLEKRVEQTGNRCCLYQFCLTFFPFPLEGLRSRVWRCDCRLWNVLSNVELLNGVIKI